MSQAPKSEKRPSRAARLLRPVQDAWLNNWSKLMNQAVQSETINKLSGAYVDTYLRALEPLQKTMEKALEKTAHQLQLPTRGELASLAGRMTNVEKKLDDILALLEEQRGKV